MISGFSGQEEQHQRYIKAKSYNFGVLYATLVVVSIIGVTIYTNLVSALGLTISLSFAQMWSLCLIATGLAIFQANSAKTIVLALSVFIGIFSATFAVAFQNIDINVDTPDVSTIRVPDNSNTMTDLQISLHSSQFSIGDRNIESLDGSFDTIDHVYSSNYGSSLVAGGVSQNGNSSVVISQLTPLPGIGGYYQNSDTQLSKRLRYNILSDITFSQGEFDLREITFEKAKFSINTSDVSLILGVTEQSIESLWEFDVKYSSLEIVIPQELEARVITQDQVSSIDVQGLIPSISETTTNQLGSFRQNQQTYVSVNSDDPLEISSPENPTQSEESRKTVQIIINAIGSQIRIIQQ